MFNTIQTILGEKCLSSSCRSVDYNLICGSDGTTYSRCQFRREQCLTGGEVRITYKDNCRMLIPRSVFLAFYQDNTRI